MWQAAPTKSPRSRISTLSCGSCRSPYYKQVGGRTIIRGDKDLLGPFPTAHCEGRGTDCRGHQWVGDPVRPQQLAAALADRVDRVVSRGDVDSRVVRGDARHLATQRR